MLVWFRLFNPIDYHTLIIIYLVTYLVGGIPIPLKTHGVKVSWEVLTFPTVSGKSFKIPWFQSPPTSFQSLGQEMPGHVMISSLYSSYSGLPRAGQPWCWYINANIKGVFVDGIHGAPYIAAQKCIRHGNENSSFLISMFVLTQ